jgi:Putative Flp pilus-assembly TadE/G-like
MHMKSFSVFLARKTDGNVAIMTALLIPLIVGGAAFGVETAYWYREDLELQQAVDKAVYAAALERRAGSSSSKVNSAASTIASLNGLSGAVTANTPTAGPYAGNPKAVEINISRPLPRFFSSLFNKTPVVIQARSIALLTPAGNACVLALDQMEDEAIKITGNTNLTLAGCSIMSNSAHAMSLQVTGNARVSTDCLIAVGGADVKAGSTTYLNPTCSASGPIEYASPANDPFAGLPYPPQGPNRTVPPGNGNKTLLPGTYNGGMDLNGGTVTFSPGVYYIKGGEVKLNGNMTVNGAGVTFFLEPDANFSINGNTTINLSAPTTGTYKGILIFAHRDFNSEIKFNGNAVTSMTGAIYAKNGDANFNGNMGNNMCTQVVAGTVQWNGNIGIKSNCTAEGMSGIPTSELIALVE